VHLPAPSRIVRLRDGGHTQTKSAEPLLGKHLQVLQRGVIVEPLVGLAAQPLQDNIVRSLYKCAAILKLTKENLWVNMSGKFF
jgi:hypothetical protein